MNGIPARDLPPAPNGVDVAIGEPPPRVHLYDYLIVLARYRWHVIVITIVGTLIVAGYTLIQPQTFSASAVLLPPEKAGGLNFADILGKSSAFDLGSLGENTAAEVFVKILRSRTLTDSMIDRYDLRRHYGISDRQLAANTFQGALDISADRQGVISLSFDASTGFLSSKKEQKEAAQFAARMLNGAIDVLDVLNRQKSVSSARRSREFIGRMRVIKRRELDSIEKRMETFQRENKAIALEKQVEASVTALADIQAEIQKTEVEVQAALSDLNPSTPRVEGLQRQLGELRRQKAELAAGRSGGAPFEISMTQVPDLTRQYANLKLDLEVATEVVMFLEAQYNKEQVQEARDLPSVQVLDWGVTPTVRSSPRRGLTVLLALPTILLLSLLGAFVFEALGRQLRAAAGPRAEELRAVLGRTSMRRRADRIGTN